MALEDIDINEALTEAQARRQLSYILIHGTVVFSAHARREMANDGMTEQDVINVLRAGQVYEPAEVVHDSWRYRCHTQRFCVVFALSSAIVAVVVTAWRKR